MSEARIELQQLLENVDEALVLYVRESFEERFLLMFAAHFLDVIACALRSNERPIQIIERPHIV